MEKNNREIHISGNDLSDTRQLLYYESILDPLIYKEFHMRLKLVPHIAIQNLTVSLFERTNQLVVYIPKNKSYNTQEILTFIHDEYYENLPTLSEHIISSPDFHEEDLYILGDYINSKN